jgi:hypothetical protein
MFTSRTASFKNLPSRIRPSKSTDCTVSKRKLTAAPLQLRKFPAEIREQIFTEVLAEDAKKRHSRDEKLALIIALRGDPELHFEAMKILYKYRELQINFLADNISVNAYHNSQMLRI